MARSSAAKQLPLFPEELPKPEEPFTKRLDKLVRDGFITQEEAHDYLDRAAEESENIDRKIKDIQDQVERIDRRMDAIKLLHGNKIQIAAHLHDRGELLRRQLYAYLEVVRKKMQKDFREEMIKQIIQHTLKDHPDVPRAS